MRVGIGFDVHRLAAARRLVLGGVEIPFTHGLEGHSDADVLLHAIADAVLGALGEGDIGRHFPTTDARYKDVESTHLLKSVAGMMEKRGYRLSNLDATVVAAAPVLAPHVPLMRKTIGGILGADPGRISIKATTHEGLDALGRGEGVAAYAVVLLERRAGRRERRPARSRSIKARGNARMRSKRNA